MISGRVCHRAEQEFDGMKNKQQKHLELDRKKNNKNLQKD